MSKIKRIPEISGNIIWLKQFEKKAMSLKNKAEVILGENWENLNDGKKIKDLIEQIKKIQTQVDFSINIIKKRPQFPMILAVKELWILSRSSMNMN